MTFYPGPNSVSEWPDTVIHTIDKIMKANPDKVAVKSTTSESTSYLELLTLSGTIASTLTRYGAGSGSIIAVLQEPSPFWIASILAVMRVGCVLLPLDLASPWLQLAAMLKHSNSSLLLVDGYTQRHIHQLRRPDITSIDVSVLNPGHHIPEITASSDDKAMILYTSGSSGLPKGVILTHGNLKTQIEPTQRIYGLESEVILQQCASSFDVAYEQIFTALCFGGSIYLLPRNLRGDAAAITDLIVQEGITLTFATPTEYSSWLRYGQPDLIQKSTWKAAICGGEAISQVLLTQFKTLQKTDLRLFNAYGPTETCIAATTMELEYLIRNPVSCPLGIAAGFVMPNYSVYIVDKHLRIVPPGVQGEIYIGGPSVALGYLNDASLTDEKFVPDIFATKELKSRGWTKMHRVGDLGRWRHDGSILIEGRISGDTQIKLRGIRIDLRDIENVMLRTADGFLSEVVVSLRRSSAVSPEFLVAHVLFDVAYPEERFQGLLQSLISSLHLPKYMLPASIIPLQQMPRTTTAKLDRKAVALLPVENTHTQEHNGQGTTGLTWLESELKQIWIKVIQTQVGSHQEINIAPGTDFFNAGGSSLLLLELQEQIRTSFSKKIPFHKLMESTTLGTMACLIEKDEAPPRKVIDWEEETAVPHTILRLSASAVAIPTPAKVVVLTGATGYLGRALLDALIGNKQIEKIYCIGIRDLKTQVGMISLAKTYLYGGDLKLPRLGLSNDDAQGIFQEADCIIHNGAQVSHMQSYHSLRQPNLHSMHELVEMSLRAGRKIPFHFISTAQVSVYYIQETGHTECPEVTVSQYPPPTDGIGGYGAAKWAGERFLERLHDEIPQSRDKGERKGWPVFIHRPTLISRPFNKPALDVIHNLRYFSMCLGAVPALPHLSQYLDTISIVELKDVVLGVVNALDADGSAVRYRHYLGHKTAPLEDIIAHHNTEKGEIAVGQLSPREWARRAGELGMDRTIIEWVESLEKRETEKFLKTDCDYLSLGGSVLL